MPLSTVLDQWTCLRLAAIRSSVASVSAGTQAHVNGLNTRLQPTVVAVASAVPPPALCAVSERSSPFCEFTHTGTNSNNVYHNIVFN